MIRNGWLITLRRSVSGLDRQTHRQTPVDAAALVCSTKAQAGERAIFTKYKGSRAAREGRTVGMTGIAKYHFTKSQCAIKPNTEQWVRSDQSRLQQNTV